MVELLSYHGLSSKNTSDIQWLWGDWPGHTNKPSFSKTTVNALEKCGQSWLIMGHAFVLIIINGGIEPLWAMINRNCAEKTWFVNHHFVMGVVDCAYLKLVHQQQQWKASCFGGEPEPHSRRRGGPRPQWWQYHPCSNSARFVNGRSTLIPPVWP